MEWHPNSVRSRTKSSYSAYSPTRDGFARGFAGGVTGCAVSKVSVSHQRALLSATCRAADRKPVPMIAALAATDARREEDGRTLAAAACAGDHHRLL